MTGPEVTAAMKAEDVDPALVEAACSARWDAQGSTFTGYSGDVARTWDALAALFPTEAENHRAVERHALAAVLPDARIAAKVEAVTEARKVISQYLATAESWRHARVMWAFAIMLGEIPEDAPCPDSPADARERAGRLTVTTVIEPRDAQRSRAAAQDDGGDPSWATTGEPTT